MRVHNKENIQYKKAEKFLLPPLFQFFHVLKLYKKEKGIFKFGILQLTYFAKKMMCPNGKKCVAYMFLCLKQEMIRNDK